MRQYVANENVFNLFKCTLDESVPTANKLFDSDSAKCTDNVWLLGPSRVGTMGRNSMALTTTPRHIFMHEMRTIVIREPGVCLFVSWSVARLRCAKTAERLERWIDTWERIQGR